MPGASFALFCIAAVLCSMFAVSGSMPTGIFLESYSEDQVKGCYFHNRTLGVCFEIQEESMKIMKTSGEEIVFFTKLGQDMFFYQIMDQGFIGHGQEMLYVPDEVPRIPQKLREYQTMKQPTEGTPSELEAVKSHYQEAVSELHYVPEIQLLELAAKALSDNSTQLNVLQPFHALCFTLFKTAEIEIPEELRAAHDLEDHRQRRCQSLRNNRHNKCLGMCGKGCWCWSIFCGDCCFHRGCYEHDLCCKRRFWSLKCLTPFLYRFRCSKYGGYPSCL